MVVYTTYKLYNFTAMDEHLTPQEQLAKLIAEGNLMIANGNTILAKLRKTLNGFLYVGIPTIALFLGSYWYNNNRMTTMENTRMTDEKLEELGFDETEICAICAHDMIEELTKLPENDYIKEYIDALQKYLIL